MLGDQAQKPKNSFKGIRRRRKTVTFTEPTYVNYSDFDYSTEDDDGDEPFSPGVQQSADQQRQDSLTEDPIGDDGAKVEPLKTRKTKEETVTESLAEATDAEEAGEDDALDDKVDGPSRSRNGTVRNTDSFKDESLETRKVTLTPNLIRDDNASRELSESAAKEAKARTSLEKELVADKDKKKSKEKDKKPSAIRSFFSRKEKKKASEDDDESIGKRSMDTASDSRDSEEPAAEDQPPPDKAPGPQRDSSRLQKPSPAASPSASSAPKSVELASYLAEGRTNDVSNVPPASMRIVHPATGETQEVPSNHQCQPPVQDAPRDDKSVGPQMATAQGLSAAVTDSKSQKSQNPAKSRTREADGSDGLDAEEPGREKMQQAPRVLSPTKGQEGGSDESVRPRAAGDQPNSNRAAPPASIDETATPPQKLTERSQTSPGQGPPAHASNPPALVDTSSPEAQSPEASPSPEQAQAPRDGQRAGSSTSKEPSWDDTKLRAFFDNSDHIRDLLAVVYDKTDVEPAGSDHPIVGGLFREQNAKLAEITTVRLRGGHVPMRQGS